MRIRAALLLALAYCASACGARSDTPAGDAFRDCFGGTSAQGEGAGGVTLRRTVSGVDAGCFFGPAREPDFSLADVSAIEIEPDGAINGGFYSVTLHFWNGSDFVGETDWVKDSQDTRPLRLPELSAFARRSECRKTVHSRIRTTSCLPADAVRVQFRVQPQLFDVQGGTPAFRFRQIRVLRRSVMTKPVGLFAPLALGILALGGAAIVHHWRKRKRVQAPPPLLDPAPLLPPTVPLAEIGIEEPARPAPPVSGSPAPVAPTHWGLKVRRVRELCGLTQRELAQLAGLSDKWVSEIENEKAGVAAKAVEQVRLALERVVPEKLAKNRSQQAEASRLLNELAGVVKPAEQSQPLGRSSEEANRATRP